MVSQRENLVRRVYDNHSRLGHLFHSVAHTFTTEARKLYSAVRHVINAKGWRVVNHHATVTERIRSKKRAAHVAREDACLKTVARVISFCERVREIAEGLNGCDGREDFFRADAHLAVHVRQNGRVKHRAATRAAA